MTDQTQQDSIEDAVEFQLSKKAKCEGSCEEHSGEVREFHVVHKASGWNWGNFWYCDVAVKQDLSTGHSVTPTQESNQ
jgi:hypothetical protein